MMNTYENISTENFGELTVLNERREQIKISTLWRKKTAALIAACTACGAKSVGADDEMVEKIRWFTGNYTFTKDIIKIIESSNTLDNSDKIQLKKYIKNTYGKLTTLNEILKSIPKLRFGYRVINEIVVYIVNALETFGLDDLNYNFALKKRWRARY